MRKALSRGLLVAFGLFLSALIIEAILQIGALVVSSRQPGLGSWTDKGALRVLAVGDSNTYGLHLTDRDQAYPKVLQKMWNARFPQRPIEVINAGVPGTNSSKLRNEFPALLRTFHPDVVTIMIGVNDFWTEPEAIRPLDAENAEEPFSLWKYSRLYRLIYMIMRAADQPEVEVEFANPEEYRPNRGAVRYGEETFDLGWTRQAAGTVPGWEERHTDNCKVLVDQARAAGASVIFLTYASPSPSYAAASLMVRKAAESTGTPLVDVQPVFQLPCPQGDCRDLYYPSQHPTAKGHRLIADVLLERLAALEGVSRGG